MPVRFLFVLTGKRKGLEEFRQFLEAGQRLPVQYPGQIAEIQKHIEGAEAWLKSADDIVHSTGPLDPSRLVKVLCSYEWVIVFLPERAAVEKMVEDAKVCVLPSRNRPWAFV
jgi:hypothetical protein